MTSKTTQTALITGASTGIGHEMARLFAADKYNLVLVARNKKKLEEVAAELRKLGSPLVTVLARDLTELEAPEELFAETKRAGIAVDVLVNNAGFGVHGDFAKTSLDDELDMIQLNIVALTHLTKLYLPQMIARRSGRIIQVASTAAFQPGPGMAIYYATKAYVLFFSEAIYDELRGTGVTVTCVCPGATETPFADRAGMRQTKLFRSGAMDAKRVAAIAYRGAMQGKSLVITGLRNWILAQSVRLGPRALVRKITRNFSE